MLVLIHHAVYHLKKSRKIRVTFSCSAQYANMSINTELMSGPNLAKQIVGMLLRFRKEHVAFMADITSMFYQVLVPPHQRNLLPYMWKKVIFQIKLLTIRCAYIYLMVLHPQVAQILHWRKQQWWPRCRCRKFYSLFIKKFHLKNFI